jgi:hypothetical protein
MLPVHTLRVKNEIHERQGEQRLHLGKRPIVPNGAERGWIHGNSRGEAKKIRRMDIRGAFDHCQLEGQSRVDNWSIIDQIAREPE